MTRADACVCLCCSRSDKYEDLGSQVLWLDVYFKYSKLTFHILDACAALAFFLIFYQEPAMVAMVQEIKKEHFISQKFSFVVVHRLCCFRIFSYYDCFLSSTFVNF